MKTVLKKAGIVVAAATACLLAVSPLAFAGDFEGDDNGDKDKDKDRHHSKSADCDQDNSASHEGDGDDGSLISVSGNSIQVPIQLCGNDVLAGVVGILTFGDQDNESNDE